MIAAHFERLQDDMVRCELCPHRCVINEGKTGICGARRSMDGTLAAESYGRITAMALDPVEKKPLRMFYPGRTVLSVSSYGCNLKCPFCQNHTLSQTDSVTVTFEDYAPWEIAAIAERYAVNGNIGVAYTYNEPVTFYEFIRDTSVLIHEAGMKNIMVTNGYINEAPLTELLPYMDAMSVDVKSVREDFYAQAGGSLPPVKRTVELAHGAGVHVEVVNLIIGGVNDGLEDMDELTGWLASVSPDIPLHITRFYPQYKWSGDGWRRTPVETVAGLAERAGKLLRYVFL